MTIFTHSQLFAITIGCIGGILFSIVHQNRGNMIQYCCDICGKEVTLDDEYIFLDSVIICSKSCGYKWIDEQFAEDDP
jgi:DNA-directed RNA polymerase subunit RPC12/RpoP